MTEQPPTVTPRPTTATDQIHGPARDTHQLDAAGLCLESCTHHEHDGPIMLVVHHGLEDALREFFAGLDLEWRFFPTEPGTDSGMRSYVVVPDPNHPLIAGGALAGTTADPAKLGSPIKARQQRTLRSVE